MDFNVDVNRSKQVRFDRALAYLVTGVAVFMLGFYMFWLIPRDVIDLDIVPDKESYLLGEDITTTVFIHGYGSAESTYERKLVCPPVENLISTITAVSIQGVDRISTPSFPQPDTTQTGTDCYIKIESSHRVQIAPLIFKTITDEFRSGTFDIVKGE